MASARRVISDIVRGTACRSPTRVAFDALRPTRVRNIVGMVGSSGGGQRSRGSSRATTRVATNTRAQAGGIGCGSRIAAQPATEVQVFLRVSANTST
jgi:hypothetical protein